MELYEYQRMIIGSSIAVLLFEICVIALLPNRLLSELFERLFQISPVDHSTSRVNFYGIQIDLKSSRRFRLSLVVQLSLITCMIILLFLDGCVMQIHFLSMKDSCSTQHSDCFIIGKVSTGKRILCQSGQVLSNLTSSSVVCFVWVYSEQNALSMINQMGICSSVFSLLCFAFQCFCRMSRKWWGLILLLLSLLTCKSIIIVSIIINSPVSMTAKILITAINCLVINVLQLLQFTHYYKRYHSVSVITR